MFAVSGGVCVLILSVLGEGYWSGFVDFVVAVKAEGRLALSKFSAAPAPVRDAKSTWTILKIHVT
jgi:hypothetical protein